MLAIMFLHGKGYGKHLPYPLLHIGQKDLIQLIKTMIRDRKANPPNQGEETLLDMIINYSNYEDLQHADALQFTTGGQYTVEFSKFLL